MTVWLISDTHFNHKNILKYEPIRPDNFQDIIFDNLDRVIDPEDTLIHCGDFTFGDHESRMKIAERWNEIQCFEKILIWGNHDNKNRKEYYLDHCGFTRATSYLIMNNVLISHYPRHSSSVPPKDHRYDKERRELKRIFNKNNCIFQVHGHTHSWCHPDTKTYMNVSVENINFMPVRFDVILARAMSNVT